MSECSKTLRGFHAEKWGDVTEDNPSYSRMTVSMSVRRPRPPWCRRIIRKIRKIGKSRCRRSAIVAACEKVSQAKSRTFFRGGEHVAAVSPIARNVKFIGEGFAAADESTWGRVNTKPGGGQILAVGASRRSRDREKESPAGDRPNLVCRPYLPPAGLKALHSDSAWRDGSSLAPSRYR
ncbi:hypothetical protein FF011L_33610 [Roseimaritima multifibrata]|uniref:Uncharacterized protein n=1 Tax=Roseimaritima multifibrata TaxID=1930274 RepID=A0A517MI75_9BACT|nr:hypothetical protein FF011L_33610 [Roseimaritima multifibrata]